MDYNALFFDVDGTLVSFNTHCVPDSAAAVLRTVHSRGVKLFIATGRPFSDLHEVEMLPYDGVVALNGSDCRWRDGRVVEQHRISYEDFKMMLAASEEFGFALGFELDSGIFVNKVTPVVREVAETIAHPVPAVRDLAELYAKNGCCQMCAYFTPDVEAQVMRRVPSLVATRWHPRFTDVNPIGISKATGVAAFVREMDISVAQIAAFGDGGNDIEMLRAAGVGVAMGNAGAEVQAAADYVTAAVDEDGIAIALEHLGLV